MALEIHFLIVASCRKGQTGRFRSLIDYERRKLINRKDIIMGLWRNIQKGVGKVFQDADPDVREAKSAVKAFLAAAEKKQTEMHGAIAGLEEVAAVGKRIGSDTDMRIAKVKGETPTAPNGAQQGTQIEQRMGLFEDKLLRAESLKKEFTGMRNDDQTGFSDLYKEAASHRDNCLSLPSDSEYQEKQLAMLNALSKCEIYGNGDIADSLRQQVDVKQGAVEETRDNVISRFRLTSESLAKDDPQEVFTNEIGRQDQNIEMGKLKIDEVKQDMTSQPQQVGFDTNQPQRQAESYESASPSM
jgi:hypothetical protein